MRRAGAGWSMAFVGAAMAAQAEEPPLRDLQSCIDQEAARYERVLGWHAGRPLGAEDFDLWTDWYVEDCGIEAITLCDRSGEVIACQDRLTAEQLALAARIRQALPDPAEVAGPAGPRDLYRNWLALAGGYSAGRDCAGAENDRRWQAWCRTRQANNTLQEAMVAWQVARYLGAARPGAEEGWARPVPPLRPRARSADD